jgi:rhodanese-related sulfurtransferase
MLSAQTHLSKFVLLTLLLVAGLAFTVAAQSVYVGQAGKEGNVLQKYIEPSELKKLVDHPTDSIWIIDVRSGKAYLNGHIPTAKSFPAGTIAKRINEIPKNQYLIIYCTVGGNAQIVSKKLKKAGFKRYINWGGISRWESERETGIRH